ncbi:MAG: thioredoxin family protein [Bacteroidia bacterium]|nr:thioredoxin family protein [Bacteroidia bacterium]
MSKLAWIWLMGLLAGLLLARPLAAQQAETVPDFSLKDETGKVYTLSAWADSQVVVVIFTSSNCSWATKYGTRLNALHEKYGPKGVAFVAINSNDPSISQLETAARMGEVLSLRFPYLKDETQQVAKQFKATKNPEVVVLIPRNKQFEVAYRGKIDDNPLDENAIKANYLQNTLENLLAGKKPDTPSTPPSGCNIRWIGTVSGQ